MNRLRSAIAAIGLFGISAAADGEDLIEVVFSGQIAEVHDYGTLPGPYNSWSIGEPYEVRLILDTRNRGSSDDGLWKVYSMSILAQGRLHVVPASEDAWAHSARLPLSDMDRWQWEGWLAPSWWDDAVVMVGGADFPVGTMQGIETLDCAAFQQVYSSMLRSNAGVFRPDDETALGPFVLSACNIVPCDPRYCPADFNCDGGVDGGDVEAFFLAWQAGESSADVNHDGGVEGQDVEVFFLAWVEGGC
jgi:hypothetical protein